MGQSDIHRVLAALADKASFQDTLVICHDGAVSAPRVVLALAFPSLLAGVLEGREDKRVVVFIPDMATREVRAKMGVLFGEIVSDADEYVSTKKLNLSKPFPREKVGTLQKIYKKYKTKGHSWIKNPTKQAKPLLTNNTNNSLFCESIVEHLPQTFENNDYHLIQEIKSEKQPLLQDWLTQVKVLSLEKQDIIESWQLDKPLEDKPLLQDVSTISILDLEEITANPELLLSNSKNIFTENTKYVNTLLSTSQVDSSKENTNSPFQHDFPFRRSNSLTTEDDKNLKKVEKRKKMFQNKEKDQGQNNLGKETQTFKVHEKIIKTSKKSWKCILCNTPFLSLFKVKMHANRDSCEEVKKKVGPYKDTNCADCGIKYPSRKSLKMHMEKHHPMQLKCSTCGKTFKRRRDWQRHNDTHSQEKKLTCTKCPYSAFRPHRLSHHTKLHHPIKGIKDLPE